MEFKNFRTFWLFLIFKIFVNFCKFLLFFLNCDVFENLFKFLSKFWKLWKMVKLFVNLDQFLQFFLVLGWRNSSQTAPNASWFWPSSTVELWIGKNSNVAHCIPVCWPMGSFQVPQVPHLVGHYAGLGSWNQAGHVLQNRVRVRTRVPHYARPRPPAAGEEGLSSRA